MRRTRLFQGLWRRTYQAEGTANADTLRWACALLLGEQRGLQQKKAGGGVFEEAAGPDQAGPGRCKEELNFILKILSKILSMMPLTL